MRDDIVLPINPNQWADALGISYPTARKWCGAGVLRSGMTLDEGREAMLEARAQRQRARGHAGSAEADLGAASAHEDLKREEALLKRARREKLELETEKLAGTLLPAEDVEERWLSLTSRWVSTIRAVPARHEASLAAFAGVDPSEARWWLQGVIDEALSLARLDRE